MKNEQLNQLERLVDENGFGGVIDALAEIANLKAQHIEENWQDARAADTYQQLAGILECLSDIPSKIINGE